MKNYIKASLLSVTLLAGMSSCNDFLTVTPEDTIVSENYYTSAEMVRANTMSLYGAAQWVDFSQNFQWKLDELVGDMYYTYGEEGQWFYGTNTNGNQYLNEGWKGLYNIILLCNTILSDMPSAASANGVSQTAITQGCAEARCIRAIAYFQLAETWKNVPIIENNSEMIASGNIQVPRNTQKSVYQFMKNDLEYAAKNLKSTDDAGRVTKYTALGMLAKLEVTMASHTDYGYDRAALYTSAAAHAKEVMDGIKTKPKDIDLNTLFYPESDNGPESLFSIQCMVYGYGYGNPRTVAWSRSQHIADACWGAGKGPTIGLQKLYDQSDKRRKLTFMTLNDYYSNLAVADGGYTYKIQSFNADGTKDEDRINLNAHIRKYIIGKSADCNGQVGSNQDAANDIYMLRLSDVYMIYAEAIMGVNDETSNADAIAAVDEIRSRAGLGTIGAPLTYEKLLQERRREFAFEATNWFDIQRLSYRKGKAYALDYLNNNNGYNRNMVYAVKDGTPDTDAGYNNLDNYTMMLENNEEIILPLSCFELPVPAAALTSSPQLADEPVEKVF